MYLQVAFLSYYLEAWPLEVMEKVIKEDTNPTFFISDSELIISISL